MNKLHEVKQFYIEKKNFTSLCFVEVSLSLSKFIVWRDVTRASNLHYAEKSLVVKENCTVWFLW